MSKFVIGQPLVTKESAVVVDAGLAVGVHRFQLMVLNAAGVKSAAVEALVQVQSPSISVGGTTVGTTGTTGTIGPVGTIGSVTPSPVFTPTPFVTAVTPSATVITPKTLTPGKPRSSPKKRSKP